MKNSSYFSEKTGEIANRGLKTQGIEVKKMMIENLRKQGKRKEALNSSNSI
jgi:hypothetical protein